MRLITALALGASLAACTSGGSGKKPAPRPDTGAPAQPVNADQDPTLASVEPRPLAEYIATTWAAGSPERDGAVNLARTIEALLTATEDGDPANDRAAQDAYDAAIWCYSHRLGEGWEIRPVYDAISLDRAYYERLVRAEAAMSGRLTAVPPLAERGRYCPQQEGASLHLQDARMLLAAPQTCAEPSRASKGVVFFNGMFTERGEAVNHKDRLERQMRGAGTAGMDGMAFYLAYNRNERADIQLLQVAYQKLADLTMTVTRAIAWLFSQRDESGHPVEELREPLSDYARISDEDLQTMITDVRARLEAGDALLFVSHSQGNFYSNMTFDSFGGRDKGRLRQVMVATPTQEVADGSTRWTTFANDVVMLAVRRFIGALPAQLLHATASEDILGHAFGTAYLANTGSWPRILGHIQAALAELPAPSAPGSVAGGVRATLTWDDPQGKDFALHVFEGDDKHLYYRSRRGGLGTVAEQVDGQPWDRYETGCALPTGVELRFGAHYVRGNGAGHAVLRLEAGGSVQDFPLDFDSANGPAGVLRPRMAAKVTAAYDAAARRWNLRSEAL